MTSCGWWYLTSDYSEREKRITTWNRNRFEATEMKIEELEEAINQINWFSKLGEFSEVNGFIPIKTLSTWQSETAVVDEYHEKIADEMTWLPSVLDMPDPFHQQSLKDLAEKQDKLKIFKENTVNIYKITLKNFRTFQEISALKTGSHNFNPVAKGAALYAFRMAAGEIVLEMENYWCSLVPIYCGGNFPCGILPDRRIVVF